MHWRFASMDAFELPAELLLCSGCSHVRTCCGYRCAYCSSNPIGFEPNFNYCASPGYLHSLFRHRFASNMFHLGISSAV
jgi:hypothetical protein